VNRVVVLSLKLSNKPGTLSVAELPENIFSCLAYLNHSLSYNLDDQQQEELTRSLEEAGETIEIPTKGKMGNYDLKGTLDEIFVMLDKLNKFADVTEPWKVLKTDESAAGESLYILAE
jgi:methionyl-tRNA synthetase